MSPKFKIGETAELCGADIGETFPFTERTARVGSEEDMRLADYCDGKLSLEGQTVQLRSRD